MGLKILSLELSLLENTYRAVKTTGTFMKFRKLNLTRKYDFYYWDWAISPQTIINQI